MSEKKRRRDEHARVESRGDSVQSRAELTGLVPLPPLTEREQQAYSRLLPSEEPGRQKSRKKEK
jgi:hypothetical protein